MTASTIATPDQVRTETIDATSAVADVVDRVASGTTRVVVEREGKPVAAVVSLRDLARLRVDDERLAERRRILEAFGEPFKDLSPDEIQREVDRAIAAVRAKRRQDNAGVAER